MLSRSFFTPGKDIGSAVFMVWVLVQSGLLSCEGDNLSPSLFKIFVNDLPSYLSNTSDPVNVNGKDIYCLMYADDIILLSNSCCPKKKF
jgi:hypothetical protein